MIRLTGPTSLLLGWDTIVLSDVFIGELKGLLEGGGKNGGRRTHGGLSLHGYVYPVSKEVL